MRKPTLFSLRLNTLLLALGLLTAANAHADDQARRAILELRTQFNGMVQTVQEHQNKIAQLSEEVAKLRGKQEVAEKTLGDVKLDVDASYANVDKRLQTLEPVPIEIQAEQSFEAAQALIQKGSYATAVSAFNNHARLYPNSAQAADVSFLRGTAAYGAKSYKMATSYLNSFMSKFPNHEKIPDALLILGNTQIESGQKTVGLETLRKLIKLYPNAEVSQTALTILNGK